VIKLATAKAKGQRSDLGENQTVQLGSSTLLGALTCTRPEHPPDRVVPPNGAA
jgi:hypothetical protein